MASQTDCVLAFKNINEMCSTECNIFKCAFMKNFFAKISTTAGIRYTTFKMWSGHTLSNWGLHTTTTNWTQQTHGETMSLVARRRMTNKNQLKICLIFSGWILSQSCFHDFLISADWFWLSVTSVNSYRLQIGPKIKNICLVHLFIEVVV